jgi:cell division protein FtsW
MQRNSVLLLSLAAAGLIAIGMIALYSTGAFAQDSHGDGHYFVKRQALWLGVGLVACVCAALVDYRFWRKTWWVWYGLAAVLLVLCFIRPIGMEINGSHRWINLGGLATFQPSEVAKLAAIFFVAHWFTRHEAEAGSWWHGFVAPLAVVGVLMGLIVMEVDIGSTALIGLTVVVMMFVAGTRLRFLIPLALLGLAAVALVVWLMPERTARVLAFLDLEKHREAEGLQQWMALIAFGSGGMDGLGLGNGRQKMLYLPYAHTDFIFPMIGEELGLRITLLVVFAYLLMFVCGACIAFHARDRFGLLLGFGITMVLTLQAAVNIGVTTALLPNKGLPLPLISYGGSNLLLCLGALGVLINIHRKGVPIEQSAAATLLRVRVRPTPRL